MSPEPCRGGAKGHVPRAHGLNCLKGAAPKHFSKNIRGLIFLILPWALNLNGTALLTMPKCDWE